MELDFLVLLFISVVSGLFAYGMVVATWSILSALLTAFFSVAGACFGNHRTLEVLEDE